LEKGKGCIGANYEEEKEKRGNVNGKVRTGKVKERCQNCGK
jgi:hypothetical protein